MKTHKSSNEQLYRQWNTNIRDYIGELTNIDSIALQFQQQVYDMPFWQKLMEIRNQIVWQKKVLSMLSAELVRQLKDIKNTGMKSVTIGQLIERSKMNEKILKAEQDVFYLKYQVGHVLSEAS